jgi:hypothetical protein
MNLGGSLPNHENLNIFDRNPPHGLSEARRAGFF